MPNIPLNMKKKPIAIIAPAGTVISQDSTIPRSTIKLIEAIPPVMPTPMTAPTVIWVVDTGRPVFEASTTVEAAASVAQ